MAKDFVGQEILVGDVVATMQVGYRDLIRAKVLKISPKMVQLKSLTKTNTRSVFKQYHDQVVVITHLENIKEK